MKLKRETDGTLFSVVSMVFFETRSPVGLLEFEIKLSEVSKKIPFTPKQMNSSTVLARK